MGQLFRGERIGMKAMVVVLSAAVGLTAVRVMLSAASAPALSLRSAPLQTPVSLSARPEAPRSTAGSGASAPTSSPEPEPDQADHGASPAPPAASTEIVVHVAGAVKHPGVYHLHKGARNEDGLKAAGGPTKEANTDAVNLAAHLEDGVQLYIPTRKERPTGGADAPSSASTSPPAATSKTSPRSGRTRASSKASGKGGRNRSGRSGKLTTPGEGQVDLNTADAAELQRLPGVGPSLAQRILDFRTQNGPFRTIEDLMQVNGIGPKKFEKMQPFIHIK